MMSHTKRGVIHRAVLLLALLLLSAFPATGAPAGPFTQVVMLGDSLSDDGNLYAATGGAVPLSPPYFEGRFSNGPVWVEYLAARLEAPLQNFAVAGAMTGYVNVFDDPRIPLEFPGLLDEIALFESLHPRGADPEALYVVWAGANDFLSLPSPMTIGPAVTNLATAVGTLAALGARHIVVPNMPDLGTTPRGLASGFSRQLTALSIAFNDALATQLKGLGVPLITVDVFAFQNQVLADPAEYGFTDVTTACLDTTTLTVCSDPDEHVFWDSIHPTTRAHAILAKRVAKIVKKAVHAVERGD